MLWTCPLFQRIMITKRYWAGNTTLAIRKKSTGLSGIKRKNRVSSDEKNDVYFGRLPNRNFGIRNQSGKRNHNKRHLTKRIHHRQIYQIRTDLHAFTDIYKPVRPLR